jgi:mercuric ion transport protein
MEAWSDGSTAGSRWYRASIEHGERCVNDGNLLKLGVIGSAIAIVCCFTPLLVVLLGVIGLSILVGWIDYVLLPTLALFLGVTVYALWRRRQAS